MGNLKYKKSAKYDFLRKIAALSAEIVNRIVAFLSKTMSKIISKTMFKTMS